MVPRSFFDHQCTMVLPQGGQPMPWNQPLRKIMINAMVTPEVAHGASPMMVMHRPERNSPQGRKYLGLARSEMDAIKNLEMP